LFVASAAASSQADGRRKSLTTTHRHRRGRTERPRRKVAAMALTTTEEGALEGLAVWYSMIKAMRTEGKIFFFFGYDGGVHACDN
jgi:hypothetical protein